VVIYFKSSDVVIDEKRSLTKTNEDLVFNLPDIEEPLQPCYQIDKGEKSCIPNVICPGVQKCGTTFLYYSLVNHPKIARSSIKEVNYYLQDEYNKEYYKGVQIYSSNFVHDPDQIIVDFSPKYMMVPEATELIYQTNKNTKFIITLRDPVDRTYSHYRFSEKLATNDRHLSSLLKGPCPRRIEEVNFKQYLQEEYHILKKCDMIDFHHKKVGNHFF